MALRLKADPSKQGGGFAVLGSDAPLPAKVAIEDRSNGLYLGEQGGWSKARVYLPVEAIDKTSVRLGPQIVDHIPSDTPIALYDDNSALVGNLVWRGIRPSAGANAGDAVRIGADRTVPTPVLGNVEPDAPENDEGDTNGSGSGSGEALPPPPPPKPGESRKRYGRALNAALALLIAVPALGYLAMQIDGPHEALVCSQTGIFHGSSLMNRLFPCASAAPDQRTYVAYLECTSGKSGCAVQSCAQTYLASKNTFNRDAVERTRLDAEKVCRAAEDNSRATAALQKLNECLSTSPACGNTACIARYEDALKVEPFASQLRQIAQRAADACRVSQEATAYSTFNQCVAGANTCDKARCADTYLSQFPNEPHSIEVMRTKSSAENACRSDEDSKSNFARLNECLRSKPNSCDQKACFDQYSSGIRTEPYVSNVRQISQTAADICSRSQEEGAFARFNQCMLQGTSCDKARCGTPFTSAYPNSSHVPQVLQATSEAARACATPTVSLEDAARRFVSRIYDLTMSATQGTDLFNLYAQNVNFYGSMTSRDQIIDEKTKYLARWNQRKFYLQPDAMTTTCDGPSGTCRVMGRVTFDLYSTMLGRPSRGVTTFDYTITDILHAPRISSEAGKVEQRF
jgi:hypothetical protein